MAVFQTFINTFGDGVFITSIDLFFETKDDNIPVGIVYTDDPCDEINTEEDLKRWQSIHQN